MENANLWLLTEGQPSNGHIDGVIEQSYRKQDANLVQEMGLTLKLLLLPLIVAIVFMYIFYMVRYFEEVHRDDLCLSALFLAALFLAAKVHEHRRKVEQVVKAANFLVGAPHLDVKSEVHTKNMQGIQLHEGTFLSTLGCCSLPGPFEYIRLYRELWSRFPDKPSLSEGEVQENPRILLMVELSKIEESATCATLQKNYIQRN
ncbi:hypothetical protein TNCT_349101 [Trichonephila clavata]|uniref:Uncharacterized protein n=1 Tax=Trichonephila clavata TaxID=2740835 RepID=A0A8X6I2P6_TRICU|nr:hypothetical protein TNCT_349101 [Trichonephila clavata]